MNKIFIIVIVLTMASLAQIAQAAAPWDTFKVPTPSCYDFQSNLSLKQKDKAANGDIAKLQRYLALPADGYFGPQTAKAVKSFQQNNGIQATGSVGPLTRARIKSLSCWSSATQDQGVIYSCVEDYKKRYSGLVVTDGKLYHKSFATPVGSFHVNFKDEVSYTQAVKILTDKGYSPLGLGESREKYFNQTPGGKYLALDMRANGMRVEQICTLLMLDTVKWVSPQTPGDE